MDLCQPCLRLTGSAPRAWSRWSDLGVVVLAHEKAASTHLLNMRQVGDDAEKEQSDHDGEGVEKGEDDEPA